MAAFPPVSIIASTQLQVSDSAPAFERENRAAIDAHWRLAVADSPRLWNGQSFLFDHVRLEDGELSAIGHRTDFATFLYWRHNGRPAQLTHITGTSLPVTADGALLAIRMADHTANAGEHYFPAGSLENDDLRDGRFDVTANIRRELAEETGLEFADTAMDACFAAAFDRNAFHIARRCRLSLSYDECVKAVERHQRRTGDDEIDGLLAVRAGADNMAQLKPYARRLAEWHFANPAPIGTQ